jgi:hypothetical protein
MSIAKETAGPSMSQAMHVSTRKLEHMLEKRD